MKRTETLLVYSKRILILIAILMLFVAPALAIEYQNTFTPIMTANNLPTGYTASASSEYSTYYAYKAFDSSFTVATRWLSVEKTNNRAWLQLQTPTGHIVQNYTIWSGPYSGDAVDPDATPKDWGLLGSNDGSSWTILNNQTGITWSTTKESKSFPFSNSNSYTYYRLDVTKNGAESASNYIAIGELYLYEVLVISPTSSFTPIGTTSGLEPLSVSFTDTSNNTPTSWNWSYQGISVGNNTKTVFSTSQNVTASFLSGNYSIKHFAINSAGANESAQITWINVSSTTPTPTPTPTPSVTVTPAPPIAGAQWCGLQDIFFQHQDSSDIAGYEEWINYPSGNSEVDENLTLTNDSWNLVDSYVTPANLPNINLIQAGLRTYYLYAYASTSAGTNTINVTVFKRNTSGGETWLYSVESGDVDAASVTLYTIPYASSVNLTLDASDRLVAKVYVKKTTAGNVQMHFVYQGTAHASYVRSGFFVCAPTTCCVSATATPTPYPFVYNPSTDKKIDYWKTIADWWWLPLLIIALIILFGRRT